MQVLIARLKKWAYSDDRFMSRWRLQRMEAFLRLVKPPTGCRIIDLGGTEYMWGLLGHDFRVTLVNLPGTERPCGNIQSLTFVEADACDLKNVFPDNGFDVVFSNSVIEHVGDVSRQAQFSGEVHRLAPAYWVQTPSTRFPIEAHTSVPFYWKLPGFVRAGLHRNWRKRLPRWCAMVENTRGLSRKRMMELFPDGEFYVERRFLFEKSYAVYRPWGLANPQGADMSVRRKQACQGQAAPKQS